MPLLDLPLEQLKTYVGRNPKPADFEAYWDRTLAEVRALGTHATRTPVPMSARFADCFDLSFNGLEGASIHAKLVIPRGLTAPAPALVRTHGYTWRAADWTDHLLWAAQGYVVLALDCRGQAGDSVDVSTPLASAFHGHIVKGLREGAESLLYRAIFADCAQLCAIALAMPEVDPERVATEGGSQGGALALVGAALEPRVAYCWSTFPFLCDYQRVYEMDLAKGAYQGVRDWIRTYDPRHERLNEVWETLGYIDVQHLCPRIRGEVRMVTGLMDDICPPSTQFAAYNRITAPKSMMLYPDYGHENLHGMNDLMFEWFAARLGPA